MSAAAWLAFLAAAGVGAPARYVLGTWVAEHTATRLAGIPWGTWIVNTVGCLLAGLVAGLGLYAEVSESTRTVLGAGGLGAFTTFSTFAHETVGLTRDGRPLAALGNVAAGVVGGALAVLGGLGVASVLAP